MRRQILFLIAIIIVSGCASNDTSNNGNNNTNQILVCVPATCCHSTACVPQDQAPDCDGVMCTMECQPDTMDCGQGYCDIVDDECVVVWN